MRVLVSRGDASYILSVQFALNAAGIPYESQAPSRYFASYPTSVVVADEDYERALEAIRDLQDTRLSTTNPRGARILRWVLLLLVRLAVAFALLEPRRLRAQAPATEGRHSVRLGGGPCGRDGSMVRNEWVAAL